MTNTNSKIGQSIFHHLNQPECLRWFFNSAIINQFPIALWQLPNSYEQQAIIDLSKTTKKINIDLNVIPPGFVFSPFDNQHEESSFLINAHLYLRHSTCTLINANETQSRSAITDNAIRFENTLEEIFSAGGNNSNGKNQYHPKQWFNSGSTMKIPQVTNNLYCEWVEQALKKIEKTDFLKVVLSRIIEIDLRKDFDPLILFHSLCASFPNAFVSVVAIPEVGTWISATPELLLSVNNYELTAVSLAGTKPNGSNRRKTWRDKELVEQAIVSDYIKECFLRQNIDNYAEQGPFTVQIGDLLHLQTKFSLNLSSTNHRIDINQFLNDLHPTPAVCGVPKNRALNFIQSKEIHNRDFYSGFLGPVNLQNQSQLFVNLRCLRLLKTSAILYAGSGITIDSIPEQECIETELKLKALLKFLNKAPDVTEFEGSRLDKYSVPHRVLCDDSI